MSRVGRKPIPIPSGAKVEVKDGVLVAEGPKGKVSQKLADGFPVEIKDGQITVSRTSDAGPARAMHGLLRSLLANAVEGVSKGYSKQLELVGVGYKVEHKGTEVQFALGYAHPIQFKIPAGVTIEVDAKANRVTVSGADRQQVGEVSAQIRRLRDPDPYKGKGVRYVGEKLRQKEGKAGAR
ncbi:MAG: 50S ribosomal protein L6 [Thermoanaerobaculia bacterium]